MAANMSQSVTARTAPSSFRAQNARMLAHRVDRLASAGAITDPLNPVADEEFDGTNHGVPGAGLVLIASRRRNADRLI